MEKEIKVLTNGINFGEIEKIKEADVESDVIVAGRLIKEKNVNVLIKAINLVRSKVPDIKCLVIGDGPEKGKLEKLAYDFKMSNNLKFTGFLEDYDDGM